MNCFNFICLYYKLDIKNVVCLWRSYDRNRCKMRCLKRPNHAYYVVLDNCNKLLLGATDSVHSDHRLNDG